MPSLHFFLFLILCFPTTHRQLLQQNIPFFHYQNDTMHLCMVCVRERERGERDSLLPLCFIVEIEISCERNEAGSGSNRCS